MIRRQDWGVRRLAHPIGGQFRGHYTHYDLITQPSHLSETERLMRIDENILRYLSINIGENVDVEVRKTELAKAEARALQLAQQQRETEDAERP